jgi:hypothetical protein
VHGLAYEPIQEAGIHEIEVVAAIELQEREVGKALDKTTPP